MARPKWIRKKEPFNVYIVVTGKDIKGLNDLLSKRAEREIIRGRMVLRESIRKKVMRLA